MSDPIRPEFEPLRDIIPILVSSKFDEDPIENERASWEKPFSHYYVMGNILDAQGHLVKLDLRDNTHTYTVLSTFADCDVMM